MINYILDKQIDSQKILRDIQDLINKQVDKQHEYILHIDIRKISYDDHTMIPKLEHKH